MEGGAGRLLLRVYTSSDLPGLADFTCARPGDKVGRSAQEVIRGSPEMLASGEFWAEGEVAVADDGGEIVGAVVYGIETTGAPAATIFSLGVVLHRQREGIGTALKRAVMAEVAQRDGWPKNVASEVHRTNFKMIGLNDKLGVSRVPDESNPEYLLCAIAVELDETDC